LYCNHLLLLFSICIAIIAGLGKKSSLWVEIVENIFFKEISNLHKLLILLTKFSQ
jgi:hypothetical protein